MELERKRKGKILFIKKKRKKKRFCNKTRGSTLGGVRHPITPHPLMSSPLLNETSLGFTHSRNLAIVFYIENPVYCRDWKTRNGYLLKSWAGEWK